MILSVGLPARGKSYIVKKLRRYLNWLQYETKVIIIEWERDGWYTDDLYKVFNVGNLRRESESTQQQDQSAKFFDPDNPDAKKIRDQLALQVLEQLIDWLNKGGRVAIHDATNSTIERRFVPMSASYHPSIPLICSVENYSLTVSRRKHKSRSCSSNPSAQTRRFWSATFDSSFWARTTRPRIQPRPWPISVPVWPITKRRINPLANGKRTMTFNTVNSSMLARRSLLTTFLASYPVNAFSISWTSILLVCILLFFFTSSEASDWHDWHIDRQIFLTRHGESTDNILGRIGGDAPVSALMMISGGI